MKAVGLVVGILCGGLAAAAPASGAVVRDGGFSYVTKRFDASPEIKTFKAHCPKGEHVYGGGPYNTGVFADVIAMHSFPYDDRDRKRVPDDGWGAQLDVRDGDATVFMYAICAKPMPDYRVEQVQVSGPPDRHEYYVAHPLDDGCAPGAIVSGGSRGSSEVIEQGSFANPSGPFWQINLDSLHNSGESSVLKLYGICAELAVTYTAPASASVASLSQNSALASCPGGRQVIAGGHSHVGYFREAAIAAVRPEGFGGGNPGGWRVWVDNYGEDPINGFAGATCATPLSP